MFHTGLDPFTMRPVYVPRSYEEKRRQRALLQSARPENYAIVRRALEQAGRTDLIGYGPDCLIKPTAHAAARRNKPAATSAPPRRGRKPAPAKGKQGRGK